jgi:tRNA dimethylallyltransferase
MTKIKLNLIALLGQTSSGKSEMAVALAQKLGRACVIGCDSRQVYHGLNIATGKITGTWSDTGFGEEFIYNDVVHYLIDFVNPVESYNVADFVKDFYQIIQKIDLQGRFGTVILTGGTGMYAKMILEQVDLGEVLPEFENQYEEYKFDLQNLPLRQLQTLVDEQKIVLNNSDYHNDRRLVSNLLRSRCLANGWFAQNKYHTFQSQKAFAIEVDQVELKQKIQKRLTNRVNDGLLNEVKKYFDLGRDKFWSLGLEYRQGWMYLHGEQTQEQFEQNLLYENIQYARRQLTWLKKQPDITWIKNLDELVENLTI